VNITPQFSIPVGDPVAWSHYKLWTSGSGKSPNPLAGFWFDVVMPGVSYARVNFASNTFPAGTAFSFWMEAHVQVDQGAANVFMSIKVDLTAVIGTTYSGVGTLPNQGMPSAASYLAARTNLGQVAGGACDTWSSVFQRFGGADPTSQIIP
jgi:hypothetical protein